MKRNLLLVVSLLLLSACGSSANAAPVIRIGLIAPFEGLGRPLGYDLLPAVRIAVAEANASGELKQYRVSLLAFNDDDSAATSAEQVRILAEQSEVIGILGPWSGSAVEGAAPSLAQSGLPALVGSEASSLPPGVLSLCPRPEVLASRMLAKTAEMGSQQAGLGGPENALSRALASASSPQSLVRSDGDLNTSIMLYSGNAATAAGDLRTWRAAGWHGQVLGGPDLARSWFMGRAGDSAEGVQALVCSAPQALVPAGFEASYSAATGKQPGHEAELAYAGARLLLEAIAADIRTQGRPTRQGVSATLIQVPLEAQAEWMVVDDGRWVPAR